MPILDDLDECGTTATGWELATASHNTVVVDGLNQRETPLLAGKPAAGSDFLFFAADPDFQVVSVDDPRAYPHVRLALSSDPGCHGQRSELLRCLGVRGRGRVTARPDSFMPPRGETTAGR